MVLLQGASSGIHEEPVVDMENFIDDLLFMVGRVMNEKFMQTLDREVYRELKDPAEKRGVTLQEFLIAFVVPEWIKNCNGTERTSRHLCRERVGL